MSHDVVNRQAQTGGGIAITAALRDKTSRFIARAELNCRSRGARLTPIRRRVLEALHVSPKPLGAYDIAAALASTGRRMAPITVYRALDFLIEQGLAHRLASQNAYIPSLNGHHGGAISAFLICEDCGNVEEATSPSFTECMTSLFRNQNFRPRAKFLEVTGWCSRCQAIIGATLPPAPSGRA